MYVVREPPVEAGRIVLGSPRVRHAAHWLHARGPFVCLRRPRLHPVHRHAPVTRKPSRSSPRFRGRPPDRVRSPAVRVDKWLGDGAMFVSTDDRRPRDSMMLELMGRGRQPTDVVLPGGAAKGPVILLEGDDYIGSAVNLAASTLRCAAGPPERAARDEPPDLVHAVPRRGPYVVRVGAPRRCPASCSGSRWCGSRVRCGPRPSPPALTTPPPRRRSLDGAPSTRSVALLHRREPSRPCASSSASHRRPP